MGECRVIARQAGQLWCMDLVTMATGLSRLRKKSIPDAGYRRVAVDDEAMTVDVVALCLRLDFGCCGDEAGKVETDGFGSSGSDMVDVCVMTLDMVELEEMRLDKLDCDVRSFG